MRSASIRLHERANASWSGGERPGRRSQAPYLGVIWQLARACAGHPILLLEVPHVSLRLQARASAVDDVAAAAAAAVRAEGFAEACWAAHSYGTFCVSRVRVLAPELVHSMVRAPVRRRPALPYPSPPLRRAAPHNAGLCRVMAQHALLCMHANPVPCALRCGACGVGSRPAACRRSLVSHSASRPAHLPAHRAHGARPAPAGPAGLPDRLRAPRMPGPTHPARP